MQANPSPLGDAAIESAVLALALAAHPKSLTIPELALEFDQGDAVEHAVVALVGVGLLDCRGISIQPSAAALHFERLGL